MKDKYSKYLPHSAGRYQVKRFRKAQCPIVERLVNSMMMHGRNNGKKLMTVRIVKHSFEIIHLLTGEVRRFLCCRLLSIILMIILFGIKTWCKCYIFAPHSPTLATKNKIMGSGKNKRVVAQTPLRLNAIGWYHVDVLQRAG